MYDEIDNDGLSVEETPLTRARLLQAGAALAAAPALLAAAERAAAATAAVRPRRGGTIRVAYGGEATDDLDMFRPWTSLGWARRRNIYEPLAEPDPASNRIRFVLAESIKPNRDGSVWTIKLRDGVRWQDGSPFTADDVVYTLKTLLDPAVSQRVGAAYLSGADPARIVKVDRLTVRVGLKEPVVDFVETLGAGGGVFMVKKNSRRTDKEGLGTGAYKLDKFTPGQSSRLVPNRFYRRRSGGNGPYADALEFLNVNSETARINALRARQIEYGSWLSPTAAKVNERSSKVTLHRSARGAPYTFNMNMRVKPFDDPRVRLAFKLACNRKQLIEHTMLGYGVIGNDMYGIGTEEYGHGIPQRAYDPGRARQLLRAAGASNLKVPIYVFNYGISDLSMSATTLYVEQLKEIGVDARAVNLPYADFRANLDRYLSTVPILSYLNSDIRAPSMWNFVYLSTASLNYTGWKRPAWDARFQKARRTLDRKRRKALYVQLQRQVWEEGGEILWGWASTITGLSPRLKGVVDIPDNYSSGAVFKDAWLTKA
jgi:peptide/nickel transport system substrate-binding protein